MLTCVRTLLRTWRGLPGPKCSSRAGLVVPLWCRPKGQGNSTDYLACPLLLSGYRARVRQPLAGQMLLSKQLLESVDVAELPDDYGIDVALTMCALEEGLPVEQVIVPFPDHDGGLHSHLIMMDVRGRSCAAWRLGHWRTARRSRYRSSGGRDSTRLRLRRGASWV